MKKKRFVFLSEEFYNKYPSASYPEIEKKHNRPYIQVCVEINGVQYAIPLRSEIHHPHVLWTDKENHCGVDFSKAVVIKEESYIDIITEPHLRQNEFEALRGKDYKIKTKMEKYIEKYKEARQDLSKPVNQILVKYSTLQYFEEEIGIQSKQKFD
jgi:protein AbiQ